MKALASAAFWWVFLLVLWLLLVGAYSKEELVAGALASVVAVGVGALVGRQGLFAYRLDYAWLARAWKLPWSLVREFALLVLALARGRPQGAFATLPFPVGGDDPLSKGRRALVGTLGTISPNAYVIDFDRERALVLLYELDPKRASGEPL